MRPRKAITTAAATSPKRVRRAIPAETSTVSKPTRPIARRRTTKAVSPASLRTAGAWSGLTGMSLAVTAVMASYLLDIGPAQQSGRAEDQHEDEDREGGHVLVFHGEIAGPHRFDQADEEAAQHRPRQRADAAEHRGGERLDAREEADEEIDHAVIEEEHQPCDGLERASHDEGDGDGAVHVDSDEGRHPEILLAGALGAPHRGPRDDCGEEGHEADGQDDDEDLEVAYGYREGAALKDLEAALNHRLHRLVARSLQELHVVLEEDRHADGGNQRRQLRRAAQGAIGHPL